MRSPRDRAHGPIASTASGSSSMADLAWLCRGGASGSAREFGRLLLLRRILTVLRAGQGALCFCLRERRLWAVIRAVAL